MYIYYKHTVNYPVLQAFRACYTQIQSYDRQSVIFGMGLVYITKELKALHFDWKLTIDS